MTSHAEAIKNRIKSAGASFHANDNISRFIQSGELDLLQSEVEEKIKGVLESLVIDIDHDHNTQETAKRVAKMYLKEVFAGRYVEPPKITEFPNAKQLDEIYTLGPITIRSACSHHLVPITGKCWIGILPSDRVIGISKFVRLVNWIMARPQIQEEATVQLADTIERLIQPRGLAVVIEATHQCMTWRGVKEAETAMTSSVMRGVFRDKPEARAEFLRLIK
jgi:GTP cyclohydrolase I